jgi:UDP-glucose 4-epimerase
MNTVLITGASGFIGANLVREILTSQPTCHIHALTRYANPVRNPRLAPLWSNQNLSIHEADIRNRGSLEALFKKIQPDIIYHLAAYNHVGQSFTHVEECFDVNAKGTANLIDTAPSTARIVYVSSSEVYGGVSIPFEETKMPQPQSPYSVTKYAGELYAALKAKQGRSVVIVRPFNTFGPWQSGKAVIPELVARMLTDRPIQATEGKQTREFVYVDDTVRGLVLAGTVRQYEGPINLGTGKEISIKNLIETLAEITQTSSSIQLGAVPYRPNEIWRMYCDNTKAYQILGWKPEVDFVEGLKRTVAWFRSHVSKDASGLWD